MKETLDCIKKLDGQKSLLKEIIDVIKKAKENNQQIFFCGNGGSANTANHMAGDLYMISGIKAISLNVNQPLSTNIINDKQWENLYLHQLQRFFNKNDILITFSVHGGVGKDEGEAWSQNLLKAIEFANENDGITIGFSGFDGGAMKEECDYCIVVPINSTPIVESFHVVLHHLIAFALQEGDRI